VLLVVDELVNAVLARESRNKIGTMLIDPADKVVCNANIEGPTDPAGEDVDPVGSLQRHDLRP
jgi:hypothetical protein